MADAIKVVSTRTVIKRITVGTPVPHPTIIRIKTSLGQLTDVAIDQIQDGNILVFSETNQKWEVTDTLNKQIIDGGDDF